MIEYLIDSASIVFLAGCVYAAYLILSGSGARAYRKTDQAARDPAGLLTVSHFRRNLAAMKFVGGEQAQAGCDFGF